MLLIRVAAALFGAVVIFAQDARLSALHATLKGLQSSAAAIATDEALGGTPELTVAKHQLRDWIESQLPSLKDVNQIKPFSQKINDALKAVNVGGSGDGFGKYGSLGEVEFNTESGRLIVTTSVGIECQYDNSVYVYERDNSRWQRILESEQNDYSPESYAPQHIADVHVWRSFTAGKADGRVFVMTLGHGWGCASAWHPVYYRVWRITSSGSKLLIDRSEDAYLRAGTFIVGSINQDRGNRNMPVDVLIEFTQRSIDMPVHNREAIRHFLIYGDQVQRVDPVALSPHDFVDEWLTSAWNESSAWSASAILQPWHRKLHADDAAAEFDVTRHCQDPDRWEVSFSPTREERNFEPDPTVYFQVRWRPPYHFTMLNVSDKPSARCTQEDAEADEWRTLFSDQDWRR